MTIDMASEEVAARLAAIVESSDDAIIGKTLDGVITSWNPAAERIFGYSSAEAIGQNIALIIPEERRREEQDVIARLRSGEVIDHFETVRVAKGGRRVEVLLTVSPIKDGTGRIVGASKIARDVTDRKRVADALQQTERQARLILEAVSEAIVIVDQEGAIVSVNRKAEEMFGHPREALRGQPVEVLLPERLRAVHVDHRTVYFRRPSARPMGRGLELVACRRDGTEFPVEISLSYFENEQGVQAFAFVTDITKRQAAERASRQAERLASLGRLSAGIAHEVNNPIGIICSRIEIMLLDAESQPLLGKVTEDLAVLHRQAQRVARIARGLLSFARESVGERAPVDLNRAVEDALLLIEKQIDKAGITIHRRLAVGLPQILGDDDALQQVLINLLTNARDALGPGGSITVETSAAPDHPQAVRLLVRDSGHGIPSDVLPRIFDPFFTTKPEGTGLGLAISYGIVRDHDGAIDVESRPGQGTTFTLTFPVLETDRSG